MLQVILTEFKAADKYGRPVDSDLELVPESVNKDEPSNCLFHYERVDDDHPIDTLGTKEWTLDRAQTREDRAVFHADLPSLGLRISKIYTLKPDEYHVGLEVNIERIGQDKQPVKFRYQLASGHGLPIEGEWYTTIYRNGVVGLLGERDNFYRDLEDSQHIGYKLGGNPISKPPNQRIVYAGVMVQYFASLVVVDDDQVQKDFLERARPTVEGEPDEAKPYLDDIMMRVVTQPLEVKDPVVHKYLLYYGPVKVRLLDDIASKGQGVPRAVVDHYVNDLHLNTLTDYGRFGWWSQLLIFFTNLMHSFLGMLHYVIRNYGVCIIVLTLIVRGLMHPISRKQAQTSIRMQAIMPEIKKLQAKHKGDRQALAVEQMALYRKHGVHPLGSCWIVFLQMPIFLGLYYALQESIHFRLASFLWMKNLAAPDMLIRWGESIPWISTPESQGSFLYLGPYFNLLPVLAVTLMIVQQKYLMPPPTDEQQEMQQKMMKYMMIVFGLMFYKVASGLCVYFIVSSLWGLAERKLLPKAKPAATAADGASKPSTNISGGKPPKGGAKKSSSKNGETNGPFKKVQEMWAELLRQAKKK